MLRAPEPGQATSTGQLCVESEASGTVEGKPLESELLAEAQHRFCEELVSVTDSASQAMCPVPADSAHSGSSFPQGDADDWGFAGNHSRGKFAW